MAKLVFYTNESVNIAVAEGLKRRGVKVDNRFQKKYGITFDKFEKGNLVKEKGFSFEVENDYHEWDASIDAITALKDKIKDLASE